MYAFYLKLFITNFFSFSLSGSSSLLVYFLVRSLVSLIGTLIWSGLLAADRLPLGACIVFFALLFLLVFFFLFFIVIIIIVVVVLVDDVSGVVEDSFWNYSRPQEVTNFEIG